MVVTTANVTRADLSIMTAWGIRLQGWRSLTDAQRAYYRTNVAYTITAKPCNA